MASLMRSVPYSEIAKHPAEKEASREVGKILKKQQYYAAQAVFRLFTMTQEERIMGKEKD